MKAHLAAMKIQSMVGRHWWGIAWLLGLAIVISVFILSGSANSPQEDCVAVLDRHGEWYVECWYGPDEGWGVRR